MDAERCCCPAPPAAFDLRCPDCAAAGRAVPRATVKALLTETALARLAPGAYALCPSPGCDTVYFARPCGPAFARADVRVPVWQKEPAGARLLCYCFGEREDAIRREIDRAGASRAVERVRAHIAADRCACDVRNPRGACCLGDLAAAVDRAAAAHI